jgi:DNA-binding MarR family transcriptional regulator
MTLSKDTVFVQSYVRRKDATFAPQMDVVRTDTDYFSWRGPADFPHWICEMAKTFDLETSPGHLLRRAQQFANDLYTNEVEQGSLTQRQFAVLFAVEQQEGVSQTTLVRMTGIDRSTLADMIVRMQGRDFLARKRTDDDQRANSVRITAAGRKALRAATPAVLRSETQILEALPARMRADFIKALMLIAKVSEEAQLAEENNGGKPKGRKRR